MVVLTSNAKDFVFTFFTGKPDQKHTLRVPIPLPSSPVDVGEFAERLISTHRLPFFVEEDLKAELKRFVDEESCRLKDEVADAALSRP